MAAAWDRNQYVRELFDYQAVISDESQMWWGFGTVPTTNAVSSARFLSLSSCRDIPACPVVLVLFG